MSPRRPAVLRGSDPDTTLRAHLVATAADLLAERGSTGLTVREIARTAGVADGALYNHFEDKEELLAEALHRHVSSVMTAIHELPEPGSATVEENLITFVRRGLDVLSRVLPAFGGFLTQPTVILRLRRLFETEQGPAPLPGVLGDYLLAEQRLGRVAADADPRAAGVLLIGACHDLVLPRVLLDPTDLTVDVPDDLVVSLVRTVLHGILPRS
jgi:AcrR family transcriptional regulator